MVERLRAFKGATELSYGQLKITRAENQIVDLATFTMEKDNAVTDSSTISFTKADGTTNVFLGQVQEIKKELAWNVRALGRGYELSNIHVIKVYVNTTPENIVKDVIDTFSENLTFASTETSGFTIAKFIAKGYLIDIIRKMMEVLDWQIRIDTSDNFFFEPKGNTDLGKTFTHGSNIQIEGWDTDKTQMINKVRVKGGTASFEFTDTFSGDGTTTTFTLTNKPIGDLLVKISGTTQTGGVDGSQQYEYDPEDKIVTFTTAPASGTNNVTVEYNYSVPVLVQDQDDSSISTHGTLFKEFNEPGIDTFVDARKFASGILSNLSQPKLRTRGFHDGFDFARIVGEIVTLVDTTRKNPDNVTYNERLVIKKIIFDGIQGTTTYEFGDTSLLFYDWQTQVMQRIKGLESEAFNEDDLAESRIFKHKMSVAMTNTYQPKFNIPRDSFIFSHLTLARFRTDRTFEPDCGDLQTSTHMGRWFGTGVDSGSQYEFVDVFTDLTSFWRLDERDGTTITDVKKRKTGTVTGAGWKDGKHGSALDFDGVDDFVDVGDDTDFEFAGADFTVEAWIRLDTLPSSDEDYTILSKWNETGNQREWRWYVSTSDDKAKFDSSSNGTLETTVTSSTALAINTFNHVAVTRTGTTLKFYLNGALDGTTTTDATYNTGTAKMYMGATEQETTSPDSLMDGRIDNVRIFSNDLTLEQIKEIHNNTGGENFRLGHGNFNGTDRYVEVTHASALSFTGDFSVALAVKVTTLPGAIEYLIHKWDATDGWAVRIAADNEVELVYANASTESTLKTGTALTAGQFQHVVFTKSGTALKSYVDGVAGNTGTGGATIGTVTDNLQIGRFTSTFLTGSIDEVKLYSDEIIASEATDLNNKKDIRDNIVAYWTFDDSRFGDRFTITKELEVS